ncbi:MAG: sigma-54 dependent transcriptional regulator [Candidatus Acidiferrum sp.]
MADAFAGTPISKATSEFLALTDGVVARSSNTSLNVLVVDNDPHTREVCRKVAAETGMKVFDVSTAEEALEVLRVSPIDVLLTELLLPGTDGLELLKRVSVTHPDVAVVMLTQPGTIDSAVQATRMGAADYVTKPFRVEELRARLEQVAHAVELKRENRLLREQVRTRSGFGNLVGVSSRMERVYRMIDKVAKREHPVLVLGESGTGKELVARSIHYMGVRKDKPFVPVECSALVATLVESELFGYTRGAFTGAMQAKQGLMESANGGTLFLDEIGEMSLEMQAKLLRALQQKEVKPVGSTERRSINVRIVAATNRDLELAIKNGSFRQDLYFRLNVVQIKLPPLRERKSDIPLLVSTFLDKFSSRYDKPREITEDAMRRLMAYDWPGNVRELENAIERAVAIGSGPYVSVYDLPTSLHYPSSDRPPATDEMVPLEELERRAILSALRQTGGDKQAAARALRIGKTTLYRKLKQYQIERTDS